MYVARCIGGELRSIPQIIKEETHHFSDDKIGLVFPSYGLCVPPYIIEFLKKAAFDCTYLFAVLSYGKYAGAAASHLCLAKRLTFLFWCR